MKKMIENGKTLLFPFKVSLMDNHSGLYYTGEGELAPLWIHQLNAVSISVESRSFISCRTASHEAACPQTGGWFTLKLVYALSIEC